METFLQDLKYSPRMFRRNPGFTLAAIAGLALGIGPEFRFDPAPDVWLPFQFNLNSADQAHYFLAAGRLKPRVTLDAANAQLKLAASEFRRKYPLVEAGQGFAAQPLQDAIVGDVRKFVVRTFGGPINALRYE